MKTGTLKKKLTDRVGHCYSCQSKETMKCGKRSYGVAAFLFQYVSPHYSTTKGDRQEIYYKTAKIAEDHDQTFVVYMPGEKVYKTSIVVPKGRVMIVSIDQITFIADDTFYEIEDELKTSVDYLMETPNFLELYDKIIKTSVILEGSKSSYSSEPPRFYFSQEDFLAFDKLVDGLKLVYNYGKVNLEADYNNVSSLRKLDVEIVQLLSTMYTMWLLLIEFGEKLSRDGHI